MPGPSDLRASDEDRDRVANELRDHFAAGRLTEPELDERVQRVYAAATAGDLEAVHADLPALPLSAMARRAQLAERRAKVRRDALQEGGSTMGAFLICCVIWLATGADGYFWPVWVAIAPAAVLVRTGWMLYGPAPALDREDGELEERSRHGGHSHGH